MLRRMGPVSFSLLPDTATTNGDDHLVIGGCDTLELAREFGTPLFVYDEDHLRARCAETVGAFGNGAVYATKAFLCTAMARLAHEEGMRLDVSTGGELFVALRAGVPGSALVFHGNNKSLAELRMGLEAGVGRIVVDSFHELERLEQLRASGYPPAPVLLRVTPGVEAHTHEYITTGIDDTKFGFNVATGAALAAVDRARRSGAVELRGIHSHIGSQVLRVDSYANALEVIAEFFVPLGLEELSVGGGLGVSYVAEDRAPSISSWGATIKAKAEELGITAELSIEPGRAIVAGAAVTLYTVGTIKELPGIRTYVSVDGGMSDNPRPMIYGSGYETFLPRSVSAERPREIRLVGKHCESGDILVSAGKVPADLDIGDIIATPVTGAYGHTMGSNYNKVLRPAVVFVSGEEARIVVRRETYEDLLATDVLA